LEIISAKGLEAGEEAMSVAAAQNDEESAGEHAKWRLENGVHQHQLEAGYGMIWIDVEDNPSSGCSWNSHTHASNCDYVVSLINAL
jgi:hypothetical protein